MRTKLDRRTEPIADARSSATTRSAGGYQLRRRAEVRRRRQKDRIGLNFTEVGITTASTLYDRGHTATFATQPLMSIGRNSSRKTAFAGFTPAAFRGAVGKHAKVVADSEGRVERLFPTINFRPSFREEWKRPSRRLNARPEYRR
jgi:hypothetical protein